MGIVGGTLGYQLLKRLAPNGARVEESAYANRNKLEVLLGAPFFSAIKDKVVIDFGCGHGAQAIELARRGARKVIGIDIQESSLEVARVRAASAGVAELCVFKTKSDERAHVIVAVDSFEHFSEPAAVLDTMRDLIQPDGYVFISFGPTWYHPMGGHLFSVFPWAHLVFTERALIRWRADFKDDGARCFEEVDGGLNKMTIGRFEELVRKSGFRFEEFETVPIRKLNAFNNRVTREFTTAIVRCKLVPR